MDRVDSDKASNYEVKIWNEYRKILNSSQKKNIEPKFIERFEFYNRSKKSFAIIQTGYFEFMDLLY